MVIKNLENKIKLVMIICSLFLVGSTVMYLFWYSAVRWRKPSMWKLRAI